MNASSEHREAGSSEITFWCCKFPRADHDTTPENQDQLALSSGINFERSGAMMDKIFICPFLLQH